MLRELKEPGPIDRIISINRRSIGVERCHLPHPHRLRWAVRWPRVNPVRHHRLLLRGNPYLLQSDNRSHPQGNLNGGLLNRCYRLCCRWCAV